MLRYRRFDARSNAKAGQLMELLCHRELGLLRRDARGPSTALSLCLRLSTNAKSSAAITATATSTRIGVHLRHAPFEHVDAWSCLGGSVPASKRSH
jgi:hypothetical protein